MKHISVLLLLVCPAFLFAQPKIREKKYPSLLWQITGNGLSKPSYLFGTMHVSNKLAFQLADSFYMGIKSADVVALETNPESWQEDMSKYETEEDAGGRFNRYAYRPGLSIPDDYLTVNTLKFYKYDKKIERSLYSNPSTINNLLYRTYGNTASDFEEDTYLDMYIYQCGKKWGKKIAGVEKYGESMKLMAEAYKDASRDRNKKERSYDRDESYSAEKIQDAYRDGDLDLLDSIHRYNSFSEAFDEKFLYKRNEIQANSIDSILKTDQSLFVGVGAAHLPGHRGVIEMLRAMGYRLRPVKMGERDSRHKNDVEKIRVPVDFSTQVSDDGFFMADIPGKFYKFGDDAALDQQQYADMANGSYYMVTRIMTNGWMWGHSEANVYGIVDSLLYENIPGKITEKKEISRNGYRGFDITNRTRRGDLQRYNIFVTPFEIIVFKISGTGDYVKNGEEADRFFGSIKLKEYNSTADFRNWIKFSPGYGGFRVSLPHEPYIGNDGSWIFDAEEKAAKTQYRIVRTDVHNYAFAEEDTFDLALLQESFASSEFIDTLVSRRFTRHKGYPALDCKFLDKRKSVFLTRFIIQGPHYYTLVAHGRNETGNMRKFLDSFELGPWVYGETRVQRDTSLYFTVRTPFFPAKDKEKIDVTAYSYYGNDEEDETEQELLAAGVARSRVIENDTTGEKIYVSFHTPDRYYSVIDSTIFKEDALDFRMMADTAMIVRSRKKWETGGFKVRDVVLSARGSSRAIRTRTFSKEGVGFRLMTQIDTLTAPSPFIASFFDSFTPADTLKGSDLFAKKSPLFFEDFMSSDSTAHKRAVKNIFSVRLDSTDLDPMKRAIASLTWKEKKYLEVKKSLLEKLEDIATREASDYLKEQYYAAGDTVTLQYSILETLLGQQTDYAYKVFRDIMVEEPPVLNPAKNNGYRAYAGRGARPQYNYGGDNFFEGLYDSLQLTRTILPGLLPLMTLDDYERPLMQLLGELVDSGQVTSKDYDSYYSKFLIEAKQELKKQAVAEKSRAIKKAEEENDDKKDIYRPDTERDLGNEDLSLYATLLMPFLESNPAVRPLMQQMLASGDKQLKYRTMLLLIRNGQPVHDSMTTYFAGLDEYRYRLYRDLKKLKMEKKFPARYDNHLDLAKSRLIMEKNYDIPDSIAYIGYLPAEVKGRKGYVYFYKYRGKKDDITWKIATVGLIPADPRKFEFENVARPRYNDYYSYSPFSARMSEYTRLDFTGFSETKIRDDEPLGTQIRESLKKMLYSKRLSAKEFYQRENDNEYYPRSISFGD